MSADEARLERCVGHAAACVGRPYPYQTSHRLERDADARPPASVHPVFAGCFDWHSAVHAHWTLARAASARPGTKGAAEAMSVLGRRLTSASLEAEGAYLETHPTFERPYGLAWLLALDAEVHALAAASVEAEAWADALGPPVEAAVRNLAVWLMKLSHPVRVGTHAQTAFAMGLALDWARRRGQRRFETLLGQRALAFHLGDRDLPVHLEPSGEDFLSPSLGTADLLRRVLAPRDLAAWLSVALPGLVARLPEPLEPADRADGRLAHLDGLNLSRAWMLEGLAAALPGDDPRRDPLADGARAHREVGLASLDGSDYAGTHWLGTFGAFLLTEAWNVGASGVTIAPP